jgi:hypothetical protein
MRLINVPSTQRGTWALPRPMTACCQFPLGMRDLSFSPLSTRRLRAPLALAGRLPTSSPVPLTCTRLPLHLGCSALPPPLSASAPTPRPPLPPTQPRRPARPPPAARRRTPQGLADRQLLAAQWAPPATPLHSSGAEQPGHAERVHRRLNYVCWEGRGRGGDGGQPAARLRWPAWGIS